MRNQLDTTPREATRVGRRDFMRGAAASAFALPLLNTRPVRSQGRYVVRIGSVWKQDDLTPDVEMEFMDFLREYSNGEFDPKFFPAGSLGSALERSQKLQAGTLEVSNTSLSNFASYVPLYNALNFPYVCRGQEGTMAAIQNGIEITRRQRFRDVALQAARDKGFIFSFWTPMGVRQVALRKQMDRTVAAPKDIEGVKMRVTGSLVERKTFEFLGANPVPIAWPETFTALQKGVADGIHNSSVSIYGFNFHEVVGTVSRTNFYPTLNLYVASRKWFEQLPEHLQEAFRKASDDAAEIQREQLAKSEKMASDGIEAAGAEFYTPTQKEYDMFIDQVGYQNPKWEPVIKEVVGDLETFKDILSL